MKSQVNDERLKRAATVTALYLLLVFLSVPVLMEVYCTHTLMKSKSFGRDGSDESSVLYMFDYHAV